MGRLPPILCKPHRVPDCPWCMGKKMPGKCEHGLTTRECFVCASPKFAGRAESATGPKNGCADFDSWWHNHGRHNAAAKGIADPRVRELMKLAFEVGSEDKRPRSSAVAASTRRSMQMSKSEQPAGVAVDRGVMPPQPERTTFADWLLAKDARDDAARLLGPNDQLEPPKVGSKRQFGL